VKAMKFCLMMYAMLLISGCASMQSMTPQDRANIKKLYVNESVKMPATMFYWDRSRSMAVGIGTGLGAAVGAGSSPSKQATYTAIGAGLGAAAGAQMAIEPSQEMVQTMKENDIDVGRIIRKSLIEQMIYKGKMSIVDSLDAADGIMNISINMYGFGQTQGFSSVLHPTLNVDAYITDKAGRKVWKKTDFITPLNKRNTPAHTFEEYIGNPNLIGEAFRVVGQAVAEWIVETIPESGT
jgi:hypothetical protein